MLYDSLSIMSCSSVNLICIAKIDFRLLKAIQLITFFGFINVCIHIARFPFVDWAQLLRACHSMSKPIGQ